MTTTGKWIDLRDGGALSDEVYVDCVIVTGSLPPEARCGFMEMRNCTLVPSGGPFREFYRRADVMNGVRKPVHEPEILEANRRMG